MSFSLSNIFGRNSRTQQESERTELPLQAQTHDGEWDAEENSQIWFVPAGGSTADIDFTIETDSNTPLFTNSTARSYGSLGPILPIDTTMQFNYSNGENNEPLVMQRGDGSWEINLIPQVEINVPQNIEGEVVVNIPENFDVRIEDGRIIIYKDFDEEENAS